VQPKQPNQPNRPNGPNSVWRVVLVIVGAIVAVAFLPKLLDETRVLLRALDGGDTPSPAERNAVIILTGLGAFAAYRMGVGPASRRRARAGFVACAGGWVYFSWTSGASFAPSGNTTAANLCCYAAAVLLVGLIVTRVRRHLHGTWKPRPGFFIVDDPPPWS
jgi:hypothetical protein